MKGYTVHSVRVAQARLALLGDDGQPLRQADAATKLGVHAVTLNRIENGKAKVSLELLGRMAELYERSQEWLLGQNDPVDAVLLAREALSDSFKAVEESAGRLADLMDVLEERVRSAVGEVARS